MDKATPPTTVLILGWLGVAPFAATALAAVLDLGPGRIMALGALVIYGAVILSFLGGVAWGFTLAPTAPSSRWRTLDLCMGVSMSLIGFFAALAPTRAALMALCGGFLAMLAHDLWVTRRGLAPHWYPSVRIRLTTAAVIATASGALLA